MFPTNIKVPAYTRLPFTRQFAASEVFIVPNRGLYALLVVGSGGGTPGLPAVVVDTYYGGSGGGGGGLSYSEVVLDQGVQLTITIGVGGGTTSSIVGGGVNMRALAGADGTTSVSAATVSLAVALGGTASGGTHLNFTGGAGGQATSLLNTYGISGGGSSASLLGNGKAGGANVSSAAAAGGGVFSAGTATTGGANYPSLPGTPSVTTHPFFFPGGGGAAGSGQGGGGGGGLLASGVQPLLHTSGLGASGGGGAGGGPTGATGGSSFVGLFMIRGI